MDTDWWSQMSSFEHLYWIIAVCASVVVVIQLALVAVSGLDFHIGSDLGNHSTDDVGLPDFQLITIRNIFAFFTVFGWVGLTMIHAKASILLTIIVSIITGIFTMSTMSLMYLCLSRLQCNASLNISLAKGQQAKVYLTIPPNRKYGGKIEVLMQGKIVEMNALTEGTESIPTGALVNVKKILNNQAVVEPA